VPNRRLVSGHGGRDSPLQHPRGRTANIALLLEKVHHRLNVVGAQLEPAAPLVDKGRDSVVAEARVELLRVEEFAVLVQLGLEVDDGAWLWVSRAELESRLSHNSPPKCESTPPK
jgi:hypothetical protein